MLSRSDGAADLVYCVQMCWIWLVRIHSLKHNYNSVLIIFIVISVLNGALTVITQTLRCIPGALFSKILHSRVLIL